MIHPRTEVASPLWTIGLAYNQPEAINDNDVMLRHHGTDIKHLSIRCIEKAHAVYCSIIELNPTTDGYECRWLPL